MDEYVTNYTACNIIYVEKFHSKKKSIKLAS